MSKMNDLIEDWIQVRATLQRHLKLLESGGTNTGDAATAARIKGLVHELNALLKEHARASPA